jgi:beta-lactamase regulating signal transducer with metallopeptidase domain
MEPLLRILLTNAAIAGLIAVVAFALSRLVRRPAVAHALWLLALLKLVTPPLVSLPLLPAWRAVPTRGAPAAPSIVPLATAPATIASSAATTARIASSRAPGLARFEEPQSLAPASTTSGGSLAGSALAAALAAGAIAVLGLGAIRFARFRRLLARAEPAPAAIVERAAELADALGLGWLPPLRVVRAAIPPMLWPEPSGPVLLLPRDLLAELTAAESSALLAHELAHVRRRDHWVRLLELAATAAFWWYPVTWWARRALRRAEERCCDEWVLRVLPRSAEDYANGLLKSLTFVSAGSTRVPALASGASPLDELETRLKEILMSRPAPRLAAPLRIALFAAAATALAVFPIDARSQEPAPAARPARPANPARPADPAPPADPAKPADPATPADHATPGKPAPVLDPASPVVAAPATAPRPAPPSRPAAPAPAAAPAAPAASPRSADQREVDEREAVFEQKRQELQRQALELRRQELDLSARAELAELRACAEKMRAEDKASEAEGCERRAEMVAKRTELERRKVELEALRAELEAKQMVEARTLQDKVERAAAIQRVAERDAVMRAEADARRSEDMRSYGAPEARTHAIGRASEEFARALSAQIDAWKRELERDPSVRAALEPEIRRFAAALKALQTQP